MLGHIDGVRDRMTFGSMCLFSRVDDEEEFSRVLIKVLIFSC